MPQWLVVQPTWTSGTGSPMGPTNLSATTLLSGLPIILLIYIVWTRFLTQLDFEVDPYTHNSLAGNKVTEFNRNCRKVQFPEIAKQPLII